MDTSLDRRVKELIKIIKCSNRQFATIIEICEYAGRLGVVINKSEVEMAKPFLVDQGMVEVGLPFSLTNRGIVWADEMIWEDSRNNSILSTNEIIENIDNMIVWLPAYGQFLGYFSAYDRILIVSTSDKDYLEQAQQSKEKIDRYQLQEETLRYLVNEGFAIDRLDIPTEQGRTCRQLTDKGRELKTCGSINSYRRLQETKDANLLAIENDRRRDFQRNEYQFWVNVSIAISTGVAAVFYLYSLFDLYLKHSMEWQMVSYFLSGFGLALLISLVIWLLRKISNKSERPT